MISEKHLAVVRAALKFWDEEMSSASRSVYEHYLHSVDLGTTITAKDIAEARVYFNEVALKYALIDRVTGAFCTEEPADNDTELSYQSDKQLPVAVLVRKTDRADTD